MQNTPVLIEYCKYQCEEHTDPVCHYCVKKLTDTQIRTALIVFDEVLGPIAQFLTF